MRTKFYFTAIYRLSACQLGQWGSDRDRTGVDRLRSFTSVGIFPFFNRPYHPIFTIFALPRSRYRSNAWTDSSQIVGERGCLVSAHFWLVLYRQWPCTLRRILDISNTENTIIWPKYRLWTFLKKIGIILPFSSPEGLPRMRNYYLLKYLSNLLII